MFCTKCGKMLPDDSRFCSGCGNAVSSAPSHTAQPRGGSVYLRPPQPMQPTPLASAYRPPVTPMHTPPASPAYHAPARPVYPPQPAPMYRPPVQPQPAPMYQPPAQPVQPQPVLTYQPPAQPVQPQPVPTYQPPVQPVQPQPAPAPQPPVQTVAPEEEAVLQPVVNAEEIINEPVKEAVLPAEQPLIVDDLEETVGIARDFAFNVTKPQKTEESNAEEPVSDSINEENEVDFDDTVTEVNIPAGQVNADSPSGEIFHENAAETENNTPVFYVEPNPVECDEPVKHKSVAKTILKVTSCIFAVIFAITTLFVVNVRMTLTEETVSEIMNETDVAELMEEQGGKSKLLFGNRFYNEEACAELLDEKPFKEYLKEVAGGYVNYILGGSKPEGISAEKMTELVEENKELVEDICNTSLNDYDYEYIEAGIKNSRKLNSLYKEDEIIALRIILSPYTLIGLIVLTLICLAGIVIFSEDKRKGFKHLGIILAAVGIFVLAMTFVAKLVCSAVLFGELATIVDLFINKILFVSYFSCGSAFGLGAVLFIVFLIMGRKKAK